MMKSKLALCLILVGLILAGCSPATSNSEKTSVLPRTGSTSLDPASTPDVLSPITSNCELSAERLAGWAEFLPYEETALFPQIFQGQSSLNLWFINPALTQASPEEKSTWAANSAFLALDQISTQDDCILDFDNYFVTVVDPLYRVWFSGSIRPADVTTAAQTLQDNGSEEVGGGKTAPTTEDSLSGGGVSCRWVDVASTLNGQFVSAGQNAAFMLQNDAGGTNLSAYLTLPQSPSDETIPQIIGEIYNSTGCLQNQLNGISITFTLPNYQLILTGYQPLNPGEGYNPSALSFNRFDAQ